MDTSVEAGRAMTELNRMGKSWFASFAYHDHIDRSHNNWNRVGLGIRKR